MAMGELICTTLYPIFLAARAVMESLIPFLFQICKKVISTCMKIFTTLNELWTDISNLAVVLFSQIQKMILDIIQHLLGNPLEVLCRLMWKCDALLLALLDGHGFLARMLFKACAVMSGKDSEAFECSRERYTAIMDNIKDALKNYKSFMDIVCNFGLTMSFGVDELKNALNNISKSVKSWTDKMKRGLSSALDTLNGLEKSFSIAGIFDCLKDLMAFINCVLDGSSICNEYSTINNYVTNVCSVLMLKHNPATGEFELNKDFITKWDKRLFQNTDSFLDGMGGIIDGMVSKGGCIDVMLGGINYSKAYDITQFLTNTKRSIDRFMDSDDSLSDVIKHKSSSLWDSFKDAVNGKQSLIITDNLTAMGLDDYTIGRGDIRYFYTYQYYYKQDGQYIIDYGFEDVTNILHSCNPKYFPKTYNEEDKFYIGSPDEEVTKKIFDTCVDRKSKEMEPEFGPIGENWGFIHPSMENDNYKKFYFWSEYCNLSNRIRFSDEKDGSLHNGPVDDDGNNRKIVMKKCNGGIMLFMNCLLNIESGTNNITSTELANGDVEERDLGSTKELLNSAVNRDSMKEKVIIGDKITSIGTLAVAMRDYLDGKNSNLVEEFGADNLEAAYKVGQDFYNFTHIKVSELGVRYE